MAKTDGLRISKRYGVNPSVTHCECCGKSMGVALFGELKDDAEAPRDVYMGLCEDCQKVVDQDGLLIIEVKDGESGKNPYRTGRIVGISKDAKNRIFNNIEHPLCYMEQTMFTKIFGNVEFQETEKS